MNRHEMFVGHARLPQRDTPLPVANTKLSRAKSVHKVRIFAATAKIPTRSDFLFPRERAGVQECRLLRSLIEEFQAVGTTRRFGFLN